MPIRAEVARGAGLKMFDLAALILAFPVSYEVYVRLSVNAAGWLPPASAFLPAVALSTGVWTAVAWMSQVYVPPLGRSWSLGLLRTLRALVTSALVLTALAFVTKDQTPRLLAALYFSLAGVLLLLGRAAWRAAGIAAGRGRYARRYAVVGAGGMAREIVEAVSAHPEWAMRFAGFIRLDLKDDRVRGPVLGSLGSLGRILEDEVIDVVIFAVPRGRLGDVERAVHVCEEQGVEVRISLDILRFGPGRMSMTDMDGVPMLAFTRTPTDALALGLKRVFDVVMSGLVLVLLAPVFVAIAVAIRHDSPGPVLFRQRRVGQNGRVFDMLKFRSMYSNAEECLEDLRAANEMSGPVFKMASDPRVTKVGRFLRRTSLDELPQFWNVLRGEMSIVGPRPPIPAEVRHYKRWQRRRLSMKPGITCIWQISGRNNVDFERWMELDLQYIDEWSLWGDIAICFKTIPAVLSARGAR
jgi:exopolysaccharide biosynthesis polyprenyl glycosylphosphotransferase